MFSSHLKVKESLETLCLQTYPKPANTRTPAERQNVFRSIQGKLWLFTKLGLNLNTTKDPMRLLNPLLDNAYISGANYNYLPVWEVWKSAGGNLNNQVIAPKDLDRYSPSALEALTASLTSEHPIEYLANARMDFVLQPILDSFRDENYVNISQYVEAARLSGWTPRMENGYYSPLATFLSSNPFYLQVKGDRRREFDAHVNKLLPLTSVTQVGPDGLTVTGRLVSEILNFHLDPHESVEADALLFVFERLRQEGARLDEKVCNKRDKSVSWTTVGESIKQFGKDFGNLAPYFEAWGKLGNSLTALPIELAMETEIELE